LFRKVEEQFAVSGLEKQAKKITHQGQAHQVSSFAQALRQISDAKEQERLWINFTEVWKPVLKKEFQAFISENPIPAALQLIEFYQSQPGSLTHKVSKIAGSDLAEYADLSKDGTGQWFKGNNQGYFIAKKKNEKGKLSYRAHAIRFFESSKQVKDRLKRNGWELLDEVPWCWGMQLKLEKEAGTEKRAVRSGIYFLGSFSNYKKVNLNSCFGEEVPQGISFESLWESGLRRI
jgi:hypothetical protein